LLVGEMLKSARESGSWGLTDESSDPGQDTFSGMAESQFANALAKSGGLGLSHMVEQSVSRQAGAQKE
ncbi:MAG: rod-binding protein, partial [Bryobacteraceae bacterium]